jgi:hypothetical protein
MLKHGKNLNKDGGREEARGHEQHPERPDWRHKSAALNKARTTFVERLASATKDR